MSIKFSFVSSKGRRDLCKPDIFPNHCKTIVSNSVHAGLDAHENPMIPRPRRKKHPNYNIQMILWYVITVGKTPLFLSRNHLVIQKKRYRGRYPYILYFF